LVECRQIVFLVVTVYTARCYAIARCLPLLLLPDYDATSIYWILRAGSRRVTWSMVCCAVSSRNKLKVQQN